MSSLVISNCPVMPTSVAHNRAWSSVSGGRTQTTSGSVQKQMLFVIEPAIVACDGRLHALPVRAHVAADADAVAVAATAELPAAVQQEPLAAP